LYDEKLSDLPPISLPARLKNRRMVYQTYHILLNPALNRKALMDSLRDSGIETNIGAYALPCLSYYHSKYGLKEDDFPNALEAYRQGLALPMGGHIQKSDVMYIRSALSAFLLSFR
jgi:dTDP-4-amino-4,6-dideoxygalactose transaminase